MHLKPILQTFWITIAGLIFILLIPFPAIAATNLSNQALSLPARLVAPEPKTEISIYPKPDSHQPRIGYGLTGDRVTVLEQVGSNEGYTWDYVAFDSTSAPKGWVRSDFIVTETRPDQPANLQSQPTFATGQNRYLGTLPQPETRNYSRQTNQRQNSYRQQQQQQY